MERRTQNAQFQNKKTDKQPVGTAFEPQVFEKTDLRWWKMVLQSPKWIKNSGIEFREQSEMTKNWTAKCGEFKNQ